MLKVLEPDIVLRPGKVGALLPMTAKNLCVTRGGRAILNNAEFELSDAPVTTVVLGPNGAGKSLLIRILAGLVGADSGQLTWGGLAPDRARMARIGFVFQRPIHLRRSAIANILFALSVTGTGKDHQLARAHSALSGAGLEHLAQVPARVLSGGEQQRLAIARAFACQPELLILDEPTSSLDPASTAHIEDMLRAIRAAGTPVLMVTHDIAQARRLGDEIVFMHRGCILERASASRFFNQPQTKQAAAFIKGEIVL